MGFLPPLVHKPIDLTHEQKFVATVAIDPGARGRYERGLWLRGTKWREQLLGLYGKPLTLSWHCARDGQEDAIHFEAQLLSVRNCLLLCRRRLFECEEERGRISHEYTQTWDVSCTYMYMYMYM